LQQTVQQSNHRRALAGARTRQHLRVSSAVVTKNRQLFFSWIEWHSRRPPKSDCSSRAFLSSGAFPVVAESIAQFTGAGQRLVLVEHGELGPELAVGRDVPSLHYGKRTHDVLHILSC
jgi:hypothetical protein